MAQIYNIISIVTFSLAGVSLALAVFCWIKFNILKVIGDLSGRTAKKSIEQMRAGNEKSGSKSYKPTPIATSRGALTKTMGHSGKLKKDKTAKNATPPASEKSSNTTAPLKDDKATVLLNYNSGETELLDAGTELPNQSPSKTAPPQNIETFEPVQDILLIHTSEVIE